MDIKITEGSRVICYRGGAAVHEGLCVRMPDGSDVMQHLHLKLLEASGKKDGAHNHDCFVVKAPREHERSLVVHFKDDWVYVATSHHVHVAW